MTCAGLRVGVWSGRGVGPIRSGVGGVRDVGHAHADLRHGGVGLGVIHECVRACERMLAGAACVEVSLIGGSEAR